MKRPASGGPSALWTMLVPSAAAAEVMDKEMPLAELWIWSVAGIVCSAMVANTNRRVAMVGTIGSLLALLLLLAGIGEVRDPSVGPAILEEAGRGYVLSAYLSPLLVLVSLAIAFYVRFTRSK